MSPAEAAAITEEPDWVQVFKDRGSTEMAFENLLLEWRKWHWTPTDDGKKLMASSVDGVIALALLGIMPPRTLTERLPGLFEAQHDEHCWLVTEGRAWRILGIEDKMLFLDSFGDKKEINLSRAKWDSYCEHHAAVLKAMCG